MARHARMFGGEPDLPLGPAWLTWTLMILGTVALIALILGLIYAGMRVPF